MIALGSIAEAETQLEIARRLKYATNDELADAEALAGDVRRILFGLRRSLRRKLKIPRTYPLLIPDP